MAEDLKIVELPSNGWGNLAAQPAGDGMPVGNTINFPIRDEQVTITPGGKQEPAFDDDAAAALVWANFHEAQRYLDENSWLLEWQYIDFLYQSPNYDREYRQQRNRPARISRYLIAKNANTMNNQIHRGIFAQQNPFILEPRGNTTQEEIDAWTEIISVLMERADFEYNLGLQIECQTLQGTGIGKPGWEEREITRKYRRRKMDPQKIDMPVGGQKTVHTMESDDFEEKKETVIESWPFYEYRRLGRTLFDPKWSTPNRPDLSARYVIDVDYVVFEDLQQMRELECYKDIPEDEELKRFFLEKPIGDAQVPSQVAMTMNANSSVVIHADGEHTQRSKDPFHKPLMMLEMWTCERVMTLLVYEDRKKIIRNEEHNLGDHALHYTCNWWNIDNCGLGLGIGRLNAGDQRMEQGVLNEVLKMIAFWFNAPLVIARGDNAPTQNVITGLGTFFQVDTPPGGDVRKQITYLDKPQIPAEAWRVYQLAQQGGEDLVGANNAVMQGNLPGPQSSMGRTATGVNRLGNKADENISKPVRHIEIIVERFTLFLVDMVRNKMPLKEIRDILSEKFSKEILDAIDAEKFLKAKFIVKVLAGQKLAAKAAIMQLIPFLLQIVQQPQLMEYLHQKGWTINFKAIEDLFMQMSELQGRQDIFARLDENEKKMVQDMNPAAQKVSAATAVENVRGANKLKEVQLKGQQELQNTVVDHALQHVSGDVPLDMAEARLSRNIDLQDLQQGVPGLGE